MTDKGFTVQTAATVEPLGRLHIVQIATVTGSKVSEVEEYIGPEMKLPG